jgi:hypothetical protein
VTRWQYRLRPTNLPWASGEWCDVGTEAYVGLLKYSDLQFRRRPRRSVVAAMRRRAGQKQQRGGTP